MMIQLKRLTTRSWMAFLIFAVGGVESHAVGLGQLQLQSWLGEPLRASVRLLDVDADAISGTCVKARLESSDGVFAGILQTTLTREPPSLAIHLSSQQAIHEPAMAISVVIDCGTQVNRTYQILLDPPELKPTLAEVKRSAPIMPATRDNQATATALVTNVPARPNITQTPAPPEAAQRSARRSARRSATPVARPVLRLSGDNTSSIFDLKFTTTLSSASAPGTNSQVTEELRAAQVRFAALIRNADPLHGAEAKAKSARERIQILQAEVVLLREQGQINQAKLDELQRKPDFPSWTAGLAGLILASLGAIIWLVLRQRTRNRIALRNWWENSDSFDRDGPETGNYDPSNNPADAHQVKDLLAAEVPTVSNKPAQDKEINFIESPLQPSLTNGLAMPAPSSAAIQDNGVPLHHLAAEQGESVEPSTLGEIEMAKVEEISDVLKEVEFWMLLNDHERVLEILEPLNNAGKPESQVPWLYLLDIYRETQDQEKYEALRKQYAGFFNVNIPLWEDHDMEEKSRSLEDFPHVVQQICNRWPQRGIVAFLESLLIDDRNGKRAGFDLPVYRDLMMLISLAKEVQKSASTSAASAGKNTNTPITENSADKEHLAVSL